MMKKPRCGIILIKKINVAMLNWIYSIDERSDF